MVVRNEDLDNNLYFRVVREFPLHVSYWVHLHAIRGFFKKLKILNMTVYTPRTHIYI